MIRNLKIIFTVLCLFATSVVTIATSKKSDTNMSNAEQIAADSLARKDYFVASNCPQSLSQERITVANDRIEYPTNLSFFSFGLPAQSMSLTYSTQVSMELNGRVRTCVRSETSDQGIPLIVYTCSENGFYLCQISFERVQ